nr:hypothetical protein [Legionella tucsonensis]
MACSIKLTVGPKISRKIIFPTRSGWAIAMENEIGFFGMPNF